MSVKLMSLVYDIPVEIISATAKSVLLAMADNAWDNGSSCFPSRGLLEHKTNLSGSTVGRALAELKDKELIDPVGKTNMNVVEWQLSVDGIVTVTMPYQSERPYPIVTETITPSQSDQQTISEPSVEPTYVDNDADGVPSEHIMVFHDILEVWKEKFPNKRQPQPTNAKMQRKVKARLRVPSFKARLWAALLVAEGSPALIQDSWFQLEYLLRNDDNYEKVASGEFDWKDSQDKRVADPVTLAPAKSTAISRENFEGGGV